MAFFNILLVTRAGSPASVDRGHHRRGARQPRKTEHRHDQSPQRAEPRCGTLHQHGRHQSPRSCRFAPRPTWPARSSAATSISPSNFSALDGLLADGKLVAIACAGLTRAAYLPNVPTVTESGLKDYEVNQLERAVRGRRHTASDHRFTQPTRGGCHSQSGHPQQSGKNGHNHASEHA